jgi:polyribonucleotide nucleotidyltransferase
MIPADCPYTIRVVSEVLESNGSSLWQQFVLEHYQWMLVFK